MAAIHLFHGTFFLCKSNLKLKEPRKMRIQFWSKRKQRFSKKIEAEINISYTIWKFGTNNILLSLLFLDPK